MKALLVPVMNLDKLTDCVLRGGLAFSFLFPPINAFFDPYSWIGYFPAFMRGFVPDAVLLHSFGVVEIIIALWILSGWKVFWPSIAAFILLFAIVFFDFGDFQVIFRDVSIATIALALIIKNRSQAFFLNSAGIKEGRREIEEGKS